MLSEPIKQCTVELHYCTMRFNNQNCHVNVENFLWKLKFSNQSLCKESNIHSLTKTIKVKSFTSRPEKSSNRAEESGSEEQRKWHWWQRFDKKLLGSPR